MRRIHRLTVLLVVALACGSVLAGEPEEPTHEGKPASWWIGEWLEDRGNRAAVKVVEGMGPAAVPALRRALERSDAARDRAVLLDLLARSPLAALPALDEVRESLRAAHSGERAAASRVLTAVASVLERRLQESGEVPEALFALLESEEQRIVGVAVGALGGKVEVVRPHADRIAAAFLKSPHPQSFTRLMRELAPATTPALVRASTSDRDALRNAAWHALSRMRGEQLAVPPDDLRAILFEARLPFRERWRLFYTLSTAGALSDASHRPLLVSIALESPREMAEVALGLLCREPGEVRDVLPLVHSEDGLLATSAMRTIAALRPAEPGVRAALFEALRDERTAVRAVALEALLIVEQGSRAGGTSAPSTALTQAQREDVWRVVGEKRETAGQALRLLLARGNPVPEIPRRELKWLITDQRTAFFVAELAQGGGAISEGTLKELLAGEDDVIALRAAAIWLSRGGEVAAVLGRIETGFDSDHDAVRRVAVLAALGLTDEQLVRVGGGVLRVLDARGTASGHAACSALLRIVPWAPSAKKALLAVADDPTHPAHVSAAGCMAGLGDDGRSRLVKLLESPVRHARRNAAVTLMQMEINEPGSAEFAREALREMTDGDDLELADIARKALDPPGR